MERETPWAIERERGREGEGEDRWSENGRTIRSETDDITFIDVLQNYS